MSNARIDEMAYTAKRIEEIIAPFPNTKRDALPNIAVLLDNGSLTLEENAGKARHTIQLLLSGAKTQFHYASTLALAGELLEGIPRQNGTMRQLYLQYSNENVVSGDKNSEFKFFEDCPFYDGLESFESIAYRLIDRHTC